MTLLLFIHLLAIGIWTGCVATEVVCELGQKTLSFKDRTIASLHWNIDKFVELPAIGFAFITGVLMLQHAPNDPVLTLKIIAGITAVCLNLLASFFIYKRYQCFIKNDEAGYVKYDILHDRVGVGCVLSITTAIVLGGYYLVS